MTELRQITRADRPNQRIEYHTLVDAVKEAATSEDPVATLAAFNKLRERAPDIATSSVTALRGLMSVGHIELAESLAERGLQKFPKFHELRVLYGEMAGRRSDWAGMARRSEFMRRKFPESVWGYLMGAVALRELGQFDAADKLLARAILMEPLLAPPAVEYSRLSERRGNLEEALRRWKRVREKFKDVSAWVEPARIMIRMDRDNEAIALLSEARWRFEGNPEPIAELARMAHRAGRLAEAAGHWLTIREQCPHDERGYIDGSRVLRLLGQQDEAERILQAYVDRRNLRPAGLIEWARIVQRRDPVEAVKRWTVIRDMFPDRDEGFVEGAAALEAIGDKEGAAHLRSKRIGPSR